MDSHTISRPEAEELPEPDLEVALAKIDQELSQQWEEQGASQTRACLFTLIVYSHRPERTRYFQKLVQQVIQHFPCRILFIQGNKESSEDYLKSHVSVESCTHGSTSIACDQITIEASAKHLSRAPFLILPHMVPDLPVYLLWGHEPDEDGTVLPQLEKFANRVIFDSEFCSSLQQFSERVLNNPHQVADMNWARVKGWRTLFQHIFHTPEDLEKLSHAKMIRIHYNGKTSAECRHNQIQATYLQGWLAGQLTWRFLSQENAEGNQRIVYDTHMGELTVLLIPRMNPKLAPGVILNVEIVTREDEHITMTREGESRRVTVETSTEDRCGVPYHFVLGSTDSDQQLLRDIFFHSAGSHYKNMLRALAQMDGNGS